MEEEEIGYIETRPGTVRSGRSSAALKLITFQPCVIVVITRAGGAAWSGAERCAFVVTMVRFRVTDRYRTGHPYQ